MIRPLIAAILAVASAAPALLRAQDAPAPKKRTAAYAAPKQAPAPGIQVVPRPLDPIVLKRWRMDTGGATAMGVTVYVTEVQLWSDGRMRWNLSFWNRSNETQTIFFDFESMVIADSQSNPYPQLGRQIISGNRGSIFMHSIPRDTRFNTWVDYKAPEEPATTFKVCVALEGRYDHRADAFKPFLVTLNEPLFLDNGVFQVEKPGAKAAEVFGTEPAGDGQGPILAERAAVAPLAGGSVGPMTKAGAAPRRPAAASTPRDLEELGEKFRAMSDEGRWVEGNLFVAHTGSHLKVRLAFKKRGRSGFVEATLLPLDGPASNTELHGAFFEDKRSPIGLSLVLRDKANAKSEFTLTFDGTTLSGSDLAGNHLTFLVRDKI